MAHKLFAVLVLGQVIRVTSAVPDYWRDILPHSGPASSSPAAPPSPPSDAKHRLLTIDIANRFPDPNVLSGGGNMVWFRPNGSVPTWASQSLSYIVDVNESARTATFRLKTEEYVCASTPYEDAPDKVGQGEFETSSWATEEGGVIRFGTRTIMCHLEFDPNPDLPLPEPSSHSRVEFQSTLTMDYLQLCGYDSRSHVRVVCGTGPETWATCDAGGGWTPAESPLFSDPDPGCHDPNED